MRNKKFSSKIPNRFHHLTEDLLTDELMSDAISYFNIKFPDYIISSKNKHLSKSKELEIQKRYVLNTVSHELKREKESFETSKNKYKKKI